MTSSEAIEENGRAFMTITTSCLESSPPSIPSSFDPAIHLHSDNDALPLILPSQSNSDDLEALHVQQAEVVAEKSKHGVVIQHRAWALGETFRSEEDYVVESPLRKRRKVGLGVAQFLETTTTSARSSSSPATKMPLISSPVEYPPSSSPPMRLERNRGLIGMNGARSNPITRAGFVMDDDEEDEAIAPLQHTRTVLDVPTAPSELSKWFTASTTADPTKNVDDPGIADAPTLPAADALYPAASFLQSLRSTASAPPHPTSTQTRPVSVRTCSGKSFRVPPKSANHVVSFEQLIAARSANVPGQATKSYYGVDVHSLLDENAKSNAAQATSGPMAHPLPSIETPAKSTKEGRTLMWTEKYRARQFTDLVGDERTHRSVLGWLKGWDPIVFPGAARHKPARKPNAEDVEVRQHRKILLLTGPPGLGKTTLAHVCARQAGYEVLEINASDERSRDVVKGRIRDCVGTENVRGIAVKTASGKVRKAGRPVCVVVDEVDGVVSGAGAGGEGGFIKALIDLVMLDQKNAAGRSSAGKKKKGDNFRLLRPLILICNDVYHPALRPLRQSTIAEVVHIRKPALNMVVSRLKTIFDREGVACDGDGVRRLCEATWGVSSRKEGGSGGFGAGEGDIRGILVVGEWVASKLRSSILASQTATARLTRRWVEQHVLGDLSHGGGGSRGMGRGSTKEVVERVFLDGAGFPSSLSGSSTAVSEGGSAVGVAEVRKRRALDRLRDMVDTCGESDRIITGCFSAYPSQPFQDDMLLSKPDAAYEWLHFHDCVSSRVFSGQEWELSGYLSQPVLAFHHLFSSPARKAWTSGGQKQYEEEDEPLPFTGPKADFAAHEAQKHNKAILAALQSSLSVPLLRSFRSAADLATDLLPPLVQMLSPEVKPVVVGGSGEQRGVASVRREAERAMVKRAVGVMSGVGVVFERGRLEGGMDVRGGGWVYRMEPPLDTLAAFETAASGPSATAPARYAVRQVLEQEHQKHLLLQAAEARQARYRAGGPTGDFTAACMDLEGEGEAKAKKPIGGSKRDFFGRVIVNEARVPAEGDEAESAQRKRRKGSEEGDGEENKVWVSFHEGFSNAVRKPVSLEEVVGGL